VDTRLFVLILEIAEIAIIVALKSIKAQRCLGDQPRRINYEKYWRPLLQVFFK